MHVLVLAVFLKLFWKLALRHRRRWSLLLGFVIETNLNLFPGQPVHHPWILLRE
jgi:hypothetical protein